MSKDDVILTEKTCCELWSWEVRGKQTGGLGRRDLFYTEIPR